MPLWWTCPAGVGAPAPAASAKADEPRAASRSAHPRNSARSEFEMETRERAELLRREREESGEDPSAFKPAAARVERGAARGEARRRRARVRSPAAASRGASAEASLEGPPPSLGEISALIQQEMTQDNAQARDPHFVPDVGTLDRWWECRRVEFEGDEALPDRSGTLGSAGDAPPFRAFAGSLEKDTLFAEARLPATHVEAWLATVVARAGKRLNVLRRTSSRCGKRSVSPTLHDDDDAPPALFDDDLTAELEQGAPDEPAWARLEEEDGGATVLTDAAPSVDDSTYAKPNFDQTDDDRPGTALAWLRGLGARPGAPEQESTKLRAARAKKLCPVGELRKLGLDRSTLLRLGLSHRLVDDTYNGLYCHTVGAHQFVRRACRRAAPEHRKQLATALWLLYLHLGESVEARYATVVTQVREAGLERVQRVKEKYFEEQRARRKAEHLNAAHDAAAAAFASDKKQSDALVAAMRRAKLEDAVAHDTKLLAAETLQDRAEKALEDSDALLRAARAEGKKLMAELAHVKRENREHKMVLETQGNDILALTATVVNVESQRDAARAMLGDANARAQDARDAREVAETALHAEQVAHYQSESELEQMRRDLDALTALADAGLQDQPERKTHTSEGRPVTASYERPLSSDGLKLDGAREPSEARTEAIERLGAASTLTAPPPPTREELHVVANEHRGKDKLKAMCHARLLDETGTVEHLIDRLCGPESPPKPQRAGTFDDDDEASSAAKPVTHVLAAKLWELEEELALLRQKEQERLEREEEERDRELARGYDDLLPGSAAEAFMHGFEDFEEVAREPEDTMASAQAAAEKAAATCVAEVWEQMFIAKDAACLAAKARADVLERQITAVPAAAASFKALRVHNIDTERDFREVQEELEMCEFKLRDAERAVKTSEDAHAAVMEAEVLRERMAVQQKTTTHLGIELEQAREMASQSRQEVFALQKQVDDDVGMIKDAELRCAKIVEEHRVELLVAGEARKQATARMQEVTASRDGFKAELKRTREVDLELERRRVRELERLLDDVTGGVSDMLDAHRRHGQQDVEDWRRRTALAHGEEAGFVKFSLKQRVKGDDDDGGGYVSRAKIMPHWPGDVLVVDGCDKAVDKDVIRPPIDLDVLGAAFLGGYGDFLDRASVAHARAGCEILQSAEGPQAPPLLLHNSLRLREGNARELLPSAGYRLEALGARKADRLHCVAARDAKQFTHARGTAAAAALAQLGRALGLAAREQQVAAEVRDFMSRQIAEHSARYATASARCENLVLAAERMDQQHLAVLEERDNHRRKLVMNARRLKQSCDAELGKMRRTLETKHDTMEVHQTSAGLASEVAQMAFEDCEGRELRRWEMATLVSVADVADAAVDAAEAVTRAIATSQLRRGSAGTNIGNRRKSTEGGAPGAPPQADNRRDMLKKQKSNVIREDAEEDDDEPKTEAEKPPEKPKTPAEEPPPEEEKPPPKEEPPKSRLAAARKERRDRETSDSSDSDDSKERTKSVPRPGDDADDASKDSSSTKEEPLPAAGVRGTQRRGTVRVRRFSMEKKIERVVNDEWLRHRSHAKLGELWLSPQQQALTKLQETFARVSSLFEAIRGRYLATHSRAQKLSGVLDRMTSAYNELQTNLRDANRARTPNSSRPSSGPRSVGASTVGLDADTQTASKLVCMRQIQTDLSWVHGCLQNQHTIMVSRKLDREELLWSDTSESASEYVLVPEGNLEKLSDFQGNLIRSENGFSVAPAAKPESRGKPRGADAQKAAKARGTVLSKPKAPVSLMAGSFGGSLGATTPKKEEKPAAAAAAAEAEKPRPPSSNLQTGAVLQMQAQYVETAGAAEVLRKQYESVADSGDPALAAAAADYRDKYVAATAKAEELKAAIAKAQGQPPPAAAAPQQPWPFAGQPQSLRESGAHPGFAPVMGFTPPWAAAPPKPESPAQAARRSYVTANAEAKALRQQYDRIAEQRDVSSIQKAEEIRARYADVSSRASVLKTRMRASIAAETLGKARQRKFRSVLSDLEEVRSNGGMSGDAALETIKDDLAAYVKELSLERAHAGKTAPATRAMHDELQSLTAAVASMGDAERRAIGEQHMVELGEQIDDLRLALAAPPEDLPPPKKEKRNASFLALKSDLGKLREAQKGGRRSSIVAEAATPLAKSREQFDAFMGELLGEIREIDEVYDDQGRDVPEDLEVEKQETVTHIEAQIEELMGDMLAIQASPHFGAGSGGDSTKKVLGDMLEKLKAIKEHKPRPEPTAEELARERYEHAQAHFQQQLALQQQQLLDQQRHATASAEDLVQHHLSAPDAAAPPPALAPQPMSHWAQPAPLARRAPPPMALPGQPPAVAPPMMGAQPMMGASPMMGGQPMMPGQPMMGGQLPAGAPPMMMPPMMAAMPAGDGAGAAAMIPLEIQQALAFVASYDPSLVQSALPPPSAGSVAVDSEPGSSRPATTEPAPKPRVEWPKSAPLKAVANLQDLLAVSREAAAAKQASPPHKSGKSPKIDLDFDAVADEEDMPAELAAVATAALESGGDVFEALQEAARDLEERERDALSAPSLGPRLLEVVSLATGDKADNLTRHAARVALLETVQGAFMSGQRRRDRLAVEGLRDLAYANEERAGGLGIELAAARGGARPSTAHAAVPPVLVAVATDALSCHGDPVDAMSAWILQRANDPLPDASKLRSLLLTAASAATEPAAAVKARRALLATLEKLVDGDGAIGEALGPPRTPKPPAKSAGMRSFAKVEAEREIRALDKLQDIHDTEENPMLDPDVRIEASYRLKMADLENAELPPDLRPKPPGAGDEKKLERRHAGVSRDKK
ncbi:hypothetical protein JL721_11528 [Aureococcus anophagefferens]|nr:hypothetical protein JL721_11528 [Aureococcus anophagefferens]